MKCSEKCIHQYFCKFKEEGSNCDYYEEPRPHGSWEGKPESKLLITRRCTACGERGVVGNFCPNCGADMRKMGDAE